MHARTCTAASRVLAALAILVVPAAGSPLTAETLITDSGGRQLRVTNTSRILSIGGDITEILYSLGCAQRIVAVDSTSLFPADALKDKKNVGYMRALSTEGVLSVDATLIIASDRSGPPEVVKALKSATVPYIEVGEELTGPGIVRKVRLVAQIVGMSAEGDRLADRLQRDFQVLDRARALIQKPLRVDASPCGTPYDRLPSPD